MGLSFGAETRIRCLAAVMVRGRLAGSNSMRPTSHSDLIKAENGSEAPRLEYILSLVLDRMSLLASRKSARVTCKTMRPVQPKLFWREKVSGWSRSDEVATSSHAKDSVPGYLITRSALASTLGGIVRL